MAGQTQTPGQETRRPTDEATGQRKARRRDPERRRQQNVRAQRRHREKVKERLAHLEALHGGALPATDEGNETECLGAGAANPGPYPHPPPEAIGSAVVEGRTAAATSLSPSAGPLNERRQGGAAAPEEDAASALDAWDPDIHVDPFLVHRRRRPVDDADGADGVVARAPLACGCGHTHAAMVLRRGGGGGAGCRGPPTLVVQLDRGPERRVGTAGVGAGAGAGADPYANHLRVEVLCTVAALQAAGATLGVAPEQACARNAPSPFARPGMPTTPAALGAVARLFASLPRDLRPGAAQIARPHPPAIDALPFPTLRRNLVVLVAAGAGAALDAFLVDALVGLVCWAGGDARPWEARSWEARPWFLHKYWALLGGEAGELVRQSAWWRATRGEFAGLVCA